MVLAKGSPDEVLLILDALVRVYGWSGRLGNIISDLATNPEKAGRILADALPATERGEELDKSYH